MASIRPPKGATKNRRIRGRGIGSGRGGTSGRGDKGQKARAGGGVRPGFEGGQMPLYRRIARRGFSNSRFKVDYLIVNLGQLGKFSKGDTVSGATLREKGLVRGRGLVKILADGDCPPSLTFEVDKISATARQKIEQAGGRIAAPGDQASAEGRGE